MIPEEFRQRPIRLKTLVDTLVGAHIKRLASQRRDDQTQSYWHLWPNRFDYVYVLFTEEDAPNPAPELLSLVHEGERFQLYRVNKERTATGR